MLFGLFTSKDKKAWESAHQWLETAERVWHFRRDLWSEADLKEYEMRTGQVREQLKMKVGAVTLEPTIDALEKTLARLGGRVYPRGSFAENIEFLLMAAIVIIGIRTYIVQPFKIPTNSMWPTYYGMKAKPSRTPSPCQVRPSGRSASSRLAPRAARPSRPIPARWRQVFPDGRMAYTVCNDRKWLVISTQVREYTFYVNGSPTTLRVPMDFHDFDSIVQKQFFGSAEGFTKYVDEAGRKGALSLTQIPVREGAPGAARAFQMNLGKTVAAGAPVLQFDILTGDQLFVDRVSFHFVKPSVGSGFVFRTNHIDGIGEDQYYIKRLVGVPGDRLEIRDPVLYRNGAPITGAKAFEKNAQTEGLYRGYSNMGTLLPPGEVLTVPENSFFALGDNSHDSRDGRYWGFVPAEDAIGRPLFIYYPFTSRWGLAK
jgi:signal peptidase I